MPKAKKSVKKDTSSFIKKVASAGRGGDSKLAYLSPTARDLLKKLGGAGTVNPKTKLKEYKAAARFVMQQEANEDEGRDMIPGGSGENVPVTTDPAASSVPTTLTPEQLAALAQLNAAGYGRLTTGINLSGIGLGGSYMPGGPTTGTEPEFDEERQRRAAEEAARRAAEAEAARKAAEEEAARKAADEAARKAAEEAARKAAAEEEARRRAEEQARYIAEQEAAARRAAEEARRVAEETEKRRLADEAARKAAEEEARRRAEQEKNRKPGGGGTTTPPPSTAIPPGLISSPVPGAPTPSAPPPSTGGIQPPPNTPTLPPLVGGTVPGGGNARTGDFIDRNLNGIDDRDEGPARTHDFKDRNQNGIDDRDERPSGGGGFDFGSRFGEDTDIGRLIRRIGGGGRIVPRPNQRVGPAPGTPGYDDTPTGGGLPSRPDRPPITGGIEPVRPGPGPGSPRDPGSPPSSYPPSGGGGYVPTPMPIPGYQASPLPTMPGAGTGTPFFNPNTGGLTPGTVPVSQMPPSLQTSNLPLQALAGNPNLSPTVLGGAENLGYYVDRFGNVILAPATPRGRKKGGPASDAELLQALQDAEIDNDLSSAKAMLDQLSNEPAESQTEIRLSPTAQSVRRTSRRPIRAETDRGTAKGMAMELEEVTKTQGPRTKGQVEDMRQKMELLRNTLGMPTFSKANLAREGELMTRRFQNGGEARSSLDELLGAAKEKLFGKDEEPEPVVQGSLPKPGPGTRRYFEEKGKPLRGSPPVGIEREAQIRSKMGPEYVDLVRENIGETAMIGDPERQWNLQGVNFTPSTSKEQLVQYMRQRLEPVLSTSKDKTLPEDKRIFAIGRAATPQIYAHEIRHEKVGDEEYNRVLDLVNAGSRPAYEDRVNALYSYHMSQDPVYTEGDFIDQMYLRQRIPFKDKERYVLNKVESMLGRYLGKEAPLFAGKSFGKETLRKNYNLNALGAQGAFKETGEKLKQRIIEQRARYPFLNFVGRENMPLDQETFPLPDYLDPEMRKPKKGK